MVSLTRSWRVTNSYGIFEHAKHIDTHVLPRKHSFTKILKKFNHERAMKTPYTCTRCMHGDSCIQHGKLCLFPYECTNWSFILEHHFNILLKNWSVCIWNYNHLSPFIQFVYKLWSIRFRMFLRCYMYSDACSRALYNMLNYQQLCCMINR